jgi:hypothetical protein
MDNTAGEGDVWKWENGEGDWVFDDATNGAGDSEADSRKGASAKRAFVKWAQLLCAGLLRVDNVGFALGSAQSRSRHV